MKLVKIFSVLGLVVMAAACGSSQPTTYGLNSYGVPTGVPMPSGPGGTGVVLIGGQKMVDTRIYGNVLTATAYVNAGERINLNLSQATYGVYQATCGTQWYNTITVTNPPAGAPQPLSNVTVTLNGQVINGSTTASTSGNVTLTANLDPNAFHIRCTDLYNNQTATPVVYTVNLGYAVTK